MNYDLNDWRACRDHETVYPKGEPCPECVRQRLETWMSTWAPWELRAGEAILKQAARRDESES